jgi:hypothetical protein
VSHSVGDLTVLFILNPLIVMIENWTRLVW